MLIRLGAAGLSALDVLVRPPIFKGREANPPNAQMAGPGGTLWINGTDRAGL